MQNRGSPIAPFSTNINRIAQTLEHSSYYMYFPFPYNHQIKFIATLQFSIMPNYMPFSNLMFYSESQMFIHVAILLVFMEEFI